MMTAGLMFFVLLVLVLYTGRHVSARTLSNVRVECTDNCTIKANLPCERVSTPSTCDDIKTDELVPPPSDLKISLQPDGDQTKAIITWSPPKNGLLDHFEGFMLDVAAIVDDKYNNDAADVCHNYQLPLARWDDKDRELTYSYTCEAYTSAFYMVRLWSTPRHHDDERQQHAIVSIKPHFYEDHVDRPGDWMAQMVIVNDSCSNEVGVTFWQAPNDYNVGMYVVTLLREGEQTCPSQICDKEVFHNDKYESAKVTYHQVELGINYRVRVRIIESNSQDPNTCICKPYCTTGGGRGCIATESQHFSMSADHPSCQPPPTTLPPPTSPPYQAHPTIDLTNGSSQDNIIVIIIVSVAVVIMVVGILAFGIFMRRRKYEKEKPAHIDVIYVTDHEAHEKVVNIFLDALKSSSDLIVKETKISVNAGSCTLQNELKTHLDTNNLVLIICSKGAFALGGNPDIYPDVGSIKTGVISNCTEYNCRTFVDDRQNNPRIRLCLARFDHVDKKYTLPLPLDLQHVNLMREIEQFATFIYGNNKTGIFPFHDYWQKRKLFRLIKSKALNEAIRKAIEYEMIENWFEKRYFHWLQLNIKELPPHISTEFATYCGGVQTIQPNPYRLNLLHGDNIMDNISTCISIPEDVRTRIKPPDDINDIMYPFIDKDGNIIPHELAKEINKINQKSANW